MNCPYCGKPLTYDDTIDTEELDERYIQSEIHYCENCKKSFLRKVYWKMVYECEKWEET